MKDERGLQGQPASPVFRPANSDRIGSPVVAQLAARLPTPNQEAYLEGIALENAAALAAVAPEVREQTRMRVCNCGRPVYTNPAFPFTDKCIFHAEEKDPQEFRDAMAQQIRHWRRRKSETWNFAGWIFTDVERESRSETPVTNMFRHAVFPVKVDFSEAVFAKDVDFHRAAFVDAAWFNKARFLRCVVFTGAAFARGAGFDDASFSSSARFRTVTFQYEVSFGGGQFSTWADFGSVEFPEDTSFAAVEFSEEADFARSTFRGLAEFRGSRFSKEARFRDAEFLGKAEFIAAKFLDNADFSNSSFAAIANFSVAEFGNKVDFSEAAFDSTAEFLNSIFRQKVTFEFAQFGGRAYFRNAIFEQNTNFGHCLFERGVSLDDAEFHSGVQMDGACFCGYSSWSPARLCGLADFSGCMIAGRMIARWSSPENQYDLDGQRLSSDAVLIRGPLFVTTSACLNLGANLLMDSGQLTIERVTPRFEENDYLYLHKYLSLDAYRKHIDHLRSHNTMEHILLEGTDCTKIRFYDCEWPRLRDGRRVVGDERRLCRRDRTRRAVIAHAARVLWRRKQSLARRMRRDAPYHLIALTYQQLAKRHREELDHPHANDFERGIFEMRRRAGKQEGGRKGWADWALFTLYKWISNYSGSLVRPVFWLLGSLAVFAWAYWGTSYKTGVTPFFWNAFKLSAEFAYLNRSAFDFALNNNFAVDLLIAAQIITTATLVTLFVFSIRRRFKHE
ncbi:MAG TPA: pentapeptide repeat-containing protein [bacterium]|jgi:hypothetical protein